MNLIEDIAVLQTTDDPMINLSDQNQRMEALSLASDRAQALQEAIANDRLRTRQQRVEGIREVTLGPFPIRTSSSEKNQKFRKSFRNSGRCQENQ